MPNEYESVIANNPPADGREWDCECARCGSSMFTETCPECGGEGYVEVDSWEGWDEGDTETCGACEGRGGWEVCASSREWCEAHPRPGREQVKRSQAEWFTFDKPRPAKVRGCRSSLLASRRGHLSNPCG